MLYNTCTSDSSKIMPPNYFHKRFNKYRENYNSVRQNKLSLIKYYFNIVTTTGYRFWRLSSFGRLIIGKSLLERGLSHFVVAITEMQYPSPNYTYVHCFDFRKRSASANEINRCKERNLVTRLYFVRTFLSVAILPECQL